MTLPWLLNPWAEVRRLRKRLRFLEIVLDGSQRAFHIVIIENADLRRRIAEIEKWVPRDPKMSDSIQTKALREAQGAKCS